MENTKPPQYLSKGNTFSITTSENLEVLQKLDIDRETFQKNLAERRAQQEIEEEVKDQADRSIDDFSAAIALFNTENTEGEHQPYLKDTPTTIQNVTSLTVYTPEAISEEVQEAIKGALRPFQDKPFWRMDSF